MQLGVPEKPPDPKNGQKTALRTTLVLTFNSLVLEPGLGTTAKQKSQINLF